MYYKPKLLVNSFNAHFSFTDNINIIYGNNIKMSAKILSVQYKLGPFAYFLLVTFCVADAIVEGALTD